MLLELIRNHMKNAKKIFITLLLAMLPLMASAQILEKAAQRSEIATVETELEDMPTTELQVFRMDNDGSYWLSVGHLGVGIDIVQIQFDPVYELFIPLGNTLDEALETLSDLQAFYKKPRLSTMEIQGCLAAIVPNDNLEPVTVTSRRFLTSKILSFSVIRDDLVRATFISRSDFGSLVLSVKMYRKIHPKE